MALACSMGLEAITCPLSQIEPCAWQQPDPADFDALLITSAQAVRSAGEGLDRLRALPVWAVGAATAQAAQMAGLHVTRTGSGGIASLLEGAEPARLLHLCGQDRTPPPPGWAITAIPVYANRLTAPDARLAEALRLHPVVLLHSARTARHFAACCPDRAGIALVAVSPAVAEAAGAGWERVAIAGQTSDEAMLEMAGALCSNDHRNNHKGLG